MTILVTNLAFTATEEYIRSLFEPHGAVDHVRILKSPETGHPGGTCLVRMPNPGDAGHAIAALDGQLFEGAPIHASEAPPLAVLLAFGSNPEASDAEPESGQPPARDSALALPGEVDHSIRFGKTLAVRYVLLFAAGLAVCALFWPGMPLHRYFSPWGVLPILITVLLFCWALIVCVGAFAMSHQRAAARKLVDDLTLSK